MACGFLERRAILLYRAFDPRDVEEGGARQGPMIKDKIARELEEIITYRREEEEEAGVNLQSVMQEENYYFDLVLYDTPEDGW